MHQVQVAQQVESFWVATLRKMIRMLVKAASEAVGFWNAQANYFLFLKHFWGVSPRHCSDLVSMCRSSTCLRGKQDLDTHLPASVQLCQFPLSEWLLLNTNFPFCMLLGFRGVAFLLYFLLPNNMISPALFPKQMENLVLTNKPSPAANWKHW